MINPSVMLLIYSESDNIAVSYTRLDVYKRQGLTGFWVLFAITLFGGMFGVLGMIAGVPIFAVIYAAVRSIVNTALRRKNMPEETSVYMNVGSVDEEGFHEYVSGRKGAREASRAQNVKPVSYTHLI